ncbi:hypothetical protein [Actinotalea sp. C106]|uniref:hypothetical protein n=1 Tax=Actinotalea sp. C106 TaxID=2908644 RepID=UPI0020285772|nr:hypothetical protein [Actinotalea sp. C106]
MDLSVLADAATGISFTIGTGNGGGDGSNFGLLLLLAGPVFYGLMYLRYRNSDKRHRHESETRAKMHDMKVRDDRIKSLKGVSNSRMRGANNNEVRGARRGITETLGLGD